MELLKQKIHWPYVALAAIVILSIFLRLVGLDRYPTSLNWDEVSHGWNAYSILKTGRDEWGMVLPGIFRAFGDYKLPLYGYLTVPFVALGGLNAVSVRLVSALSGIGAVVFGYLLTVNLLKIGAKEEDRKWKRWVGVGTALGIGLAPWTIFLSRIAVEANLASFLIIMGAYFFVKGVRQIEEEKKLSWAFTGTGISWGLSLFAYNSARGFVPLLIGWLVLVFWDYWGFDWSSKRWLPEKLKVWFSSSYKDKLKCWCHGVGLGFFLLFLLGMVVQMSWSETGQARLENIFVVDIGMINRINEARGVSDLPDPLPSIIHNKVTHGLGASLLNYISFFDPRYWYGHGGTHYQFEVPGLPLWLMANLPLAAWGLLHLKKIGVKARLFILGWILLAPIPASITRDNPHTLRIITMLPMMQLVAAWGGIQLLRQIKDRTAVDQRSVVLGTIISIYLLAVGWQVSSFMKVYTGSYSQSYSWVWQDGNKQMVKYVRSVEENYDQIFITRKYGEPQVFMTFYWPWDPLDYQRNKRWEYRDAGTSVAWYWIHEYDKFTFLNDWEVVEMLLAEDLYNLNREKWLLVTTSGNAPDNWEYLHDIEDSYGKLVYEVYEYEN